MKKPRADRARRDGCRCRSRLCASLGHDARQQRQAQRVQLVRQAVVDHRQHARIAEQHLVDAARRRVALVGGQHVGVEQARGCRAARRRTRAPWPAACSCDCGSAHARPRGAAWRSSSRACASRAMQRGIERVADVEVLAVLAQVGRAQPHREQRALELLDHLLDGQRRRQLAAARLAGSVVGGAPVVARGAQAAHDVGQVEGGAHVVVVSVARARTLAQNGRACLARAPRHPTREDVRSPTSSARGGLVR